MRTLAILDDDAVRAVTLKTSLEAEGFRADHVHDPDALRARAYALLLLDLGMPRALELVRSTSQPVICLTDETCSDACLSALASGADDCLRRPFAPRELFARIRNVLRRAGADEDPLELDTLTVFVHSMRVRIGNDTHELTRGESEILSLLLEHAPAPLTIDRMLALLPPESRVKRGTMESRIKSLRKKLGAGRLVNRAALGYQLVEST